MGGRGASSYTRLNNLGKNIDFSRLDKPINYSKAGASFSKLPISAQKNIENNLQISQVLKDDIKNGSRNKAQDVWTTGLATQKTKIKVITEYNGGKLQYTVKQQNKILLKTDNKDQVANKVARFYLEGMR